MAEIGGENFINSDDILARLEKLENDGPCDDEESAELQELRSLANEAMLEERTVVFYKDTYFSEAMERDAVDFGFISPDSPVGAYVDWDSYADGCQIDYTEYKIGGYTYYARG